MNVQQIKIFRTNSVLRRLLAFSFHYRLFSAPCSRVIEICAKNPACIISHQNRVELLKYAQKILLSFRIVEICAKNPAFFLGNLIKGIHPTKTEVADERCGWRRV